MLPQQAEPQEHRIALVTGKLFQSAAVLVWKQVRVRSSEVVNQAGQARELASTAVARLQEPTLVQLTLVNLECDCTAKHLAALVTAVFHRPQMNR